ncbi:Trifunctional NAD biosynthesis/regulator protein NadR [Moraxella lacunata]|uniref:Trifunctional NAD biosynthesis/regulator protein NadR n=1 Tax=Moraxella lacunata TaxID=477 RepID=A0A378TT52_MORLA|nr:ATP-binding protein [Moraxella lacunata]STZ63999.1 Trifunctional NAD biosynthesis/regulator protein NadR [Moraxella lacunata]
MARYNSLFTHQIILPKMTVKKILLIGAECTGKSTLAHALADKYNTTYTPEYLRTYLEQKPTGHVCTFDDLTPIAQGQMDSEKHAVATAHRYCFIDTSLLLLYIYSQHYFNKTPKIILDNLNNQYDLILVTDDIGITWIDDGMRDLPNGRQQMRQTIIKELENRQLTYHAISGNLENRIKQVGELLKNL